MSEIITKKRFNIITGAEIMDASKRVFRSVVGSDPVRIDKKGSSSLGVLEKFAKIEVDGINPNERIVGKLIAYYKVYVLCVIVLHSRSLATPKSSKFFINFYEIENEERAMRRGQITICSGDGVRKAEQGSTGEIDKLERSLGQQTSGNGSKGEKWFSGNKFYLKVVAGPVLILVVAWIILKIRNWV